MMPAPSGRVTFGAFELDLESGTLRKSGRVRTLRPQPLRVLCLLVGQAGRLVSRDEIRRLLWDEATFVGYDTGVDYCVQHIRSALGDDAQAPRYVETLPRRGYRFIAPVRYERPFEEPTLAVLPFSNLNRDPEKDYFADGVTDALITELASIPAVRVISRQSVLHLKGSSLKLDEIARELGVSGVVEGAALVEGRRVRVSVQLILLDPERHAWAHSYDCDLSAVLATQCEAARAIAGSVAAALRSSGAVPPPQVAAKAVAPEIAETYLRARSEFDKMTAEGIGNALRHSRREAPGASGRRHRRRSRHGPPGPRLDGPAPRLGPGRGHPGGAAGHRATSRQVVYERGGDGPSIGLDQAAASRAG